MSRRKDEDEDAMDVDEDADADAGDDADSYKYSSDDGEGGDDDDGGRGAKPAPAHAHAASVSATKSTPASATSSRAPFSSGGKSSASSSLKGSASKRAAASAGSHDYRGLSPEMLRELQGSLIREVAEVLNLPEDHAAVLLVHFKWNRERLMDAFYSDPERTRKDAGAFQGDVRRGASHIASAVASGFGASAGAGAGAPTSPTAKRAPPQNKPPPSTFTCPVLFEDVPYDETLTMGCEAPGEPEHRISLSAWRQYLIDAVEHDGAACVKTRCPMGGCSCVVSSRVWRCVLASPALPPVVGSPAPAPSSSSSAAPAPAPPTTNATQDRTPARAAAEALLRYERYLASNFVDINKMIKWCPSPSCSWAVEALTGGVTSVKCESCGFWFCFQCREDAHSPLSCAGLAVWKEKCAGESETVNWFVANTKKCPNCQTFIEKNNGCNHMHCSQCRFDFCWVCLGKWSDHNSNTGGYYNCNRFDEKAGGGKAGGGKTGAGAGAGAGAGGASSGPDVATAKRDLERYIHYYTRFQNHQRSLAFANKQRAEAERRMSDLQSKGGAGWIDVQFIMEGVEQLIDCRRVLMYTYALAYQMKDGPQKTLFEYNQGMLEVNTEKLSELTEMDPLKMNRAEVINFTKVTGGFLRKLIEHVEEQRLA